MLYKYTVQRSTFLWPRSAVLRTIDTFYRYARGTTIIPLSPKLCGQDKNSEIFQGRWREITYLSAPDITTIFNHASKYNNKDADCDGIFSVLNGSGKCLNIYKKIYKKNQGLSREVALAENKEALARLMDDCRSTSPSVLARGDLSWITVKLISPRLFWTFFTE